MFRYCLLLLPLFFAACGNHSGGSAGTAGGDSSEATGAAVSGDFYKRFSGTVAGRSVVVQMHRWSGTMQGSYQYTAVGQVIELYQTTDPEAAEGRYVFTEMAPGDRADDNPADPKWIVTLTDTRLSGEWHSRDGLKTYPIDLREDYPPGSTRLNAYYIGDSSALLPGRASSPKATANCSYLLPAEDAAGFLYNAMRRQVSPTGKGGDVVAAIKADNAAYFDNYRAENASLVSDTISEEESFSFNFTSDQLVSVLHNGDGWLVLQSFSSSYTGGAHGNYGSSYANLDVSGSREWTVTDMVTDTAALRPMLNDAAIAYFRLKPGEGMDERMLVDEVPATGNVYLSPAGLSFVYNPYEIASYADGQVALFLPFKKLMPFLTPAFRARMKLSARAGVAMRQASCRSRRYL